MQHFQLSGICANALRGVKMPLNFNRKNLNVWCHLATWLLVFWSKTIRPNDICSTQYKEKTSWIAKTNGRKPKRC